MPEIQSPHQKVVGDVLALYHQIKVLHAMTHQTIMELHERMKRDKLPMEAMGDIAYAMKHATAMLEDTRKSTKSVVELAERLACLHYVSKSLNEPSTAPIRGMISSCTPKVTLAVVLPTLKKNPDGYRTMMLALGCPEALLDDEALKPNWKRLNEIATERSEKGQPAIPGLDLANTYPDYALIARGLKDADVDDPKALMKKGISINHKRLNLDAVRASGFCRRKNESERRQ